MDHNKTKIIVAGHICLDMAPYFPTIKSLDSISPGDLIELGRASLSIGGAVSNTGIALQKLGLPASLIGKVGNDEFGQVVLDHLKRINPELTKGMIISENVHTSYSMIVDIPNTDRIIFHYPGANHTFNSEDITEEDLKHTQLFHFGYPSVMKKFYQDNGGQLVEVLKKAKNAGSITTLDMVLPDPNSEAMKVDWGKLFKNVLPLVDIFLPSIEEMMLILHPEKHEILKNKTRGDNIISMISEEDIRSLADELLFMGSQVVVLKLGEKGMYLKTAENLNEREGHEIFLDNDWSSRELWTPCYKVKVKGTTGAGDSSIAGFICGLLKGYSPEKVLCGAAAIGAASVEKSDATSGVLPWEEMEKRVENGWNKQSLDLTLSNRWKWDDFSQLWVGPDNKKEV